MSSRAVTQAGRSGFLPNLQGLRALAAASVAFSHIAHDALQNTAHPSHVVGMVSALMPWGAGVDIFFVISGFVIVHASAPLFATGHSGLLTFLQRRLARIVPLYWLMTAAFLAVLWLGHSAIHGDIGGWRYIIASFLFIPWPRPDGLMEPAFGLGWTLNFEMFFYLVFTPFLWLPRHLALPGAITAFAIFVAIGHFHPFTTPCLAFWSQPIILEFCTGMALAGLAARGAKMPIIARL
ncbi:MAG: acyltransferase, partial [Acidocella sp.]|nr:acyltransferase [Acidocella sp.]